MMLPRIQALLAAIWAGLIIACGALAAPALFAVLERPMAGTGAGAIFSLEARVSLAFAALLFVIERRRVRDLLEGGAKISQVSTNLLLTLVVLFITIFGEFVLLPLIQDAKAGVSTALSFGALHGISAGLFWLKALLVLTMAWRLGAPKA